MGRVGGMFGSYSGSFGKSGSSSGKVKSRPGFNAKATGYGRRKKKKKAR